MSAIESVFEILREDRMGKLAFDLYSTGYGCGNAIHDMRKCGLLNHPIGVEFINKMRNIEKIGITENRYGYTTKWREVQ